MSCGRPECRCGDAAQGHEPDHDCGHATEAGCCGGEHGPTEAVEGPEEAPRKRNPWTGEWIDVKAWSR